MAVVATRKIQKKKIYNLGAKMLAFKMCGVGRRLTRNNKEEK